MPHVAVAFPFVLGWCPHASITVFTDSHRLKVTRVYARPITAQMIYNEPVWYVAYKYRITHTVG